MLTGPILISDLLGPVKKPRMINEIVSDKASNYLLYSEEGFPKKCHFCKTEEQTTLPGGMLLGRLSHP